MNNEVLDLIIESLVEEKIEDCWLDRMSSKDYSYITNRIFKCDECHKWREDYERIYTGVSVICEKCQNAAIAESED